MDLSRNLLDIDDELDAMIENALPEEETNKKSKTSKFKLSVVPTEKEKSRESLVEITRGEENVTSDDRRTTRRTTRLRSRGKLI